MQVRRKETAKIERQMLYRVTDMDSVGGGGA